MKKAPVSPVLLALIVAVPALAVIPEFWETRTWEEWREGDLDGLSVTGEGELVLAPRFETLYDTGEPLVFSAASDSSGNVYLGTGHQGRVFRVDARGVGTLVADFGELDVLALAVGPDDGLFAATSPNGKVYRIEAAGNEVFFDPEDLYIWDMLFDREGRLLVATGEEGVIYLVEPDGSSRVFYDSENTHILSMALAPSGDVIAGGSPGGYLYRISDAGRAFVLYDSGMREVRAITVSPDGRIYAAVLDAAPAPTPGSSSTPASPSPTSGDSDNAAGGSGIGGAAARGPGTGTPRSRILEVLPSGAVASVWESGSEMVFSVLHSGERLFFSTGTRGRVYVLGASRRPTLLVESTEEQTTRLFGARGRFLAVSSNRGKLWELGEGGRTRGVYESAVRDTGAISTWGKASWAGRGVLISTRSGNTHRPDSTWSDWENPGPEGDVVSPSARFIQWRAILDSGAGEAVPRLSSLTLPYLQQNFRPDVTALEILQPGLALREQQATGNPNAVESPGISGRVEAVMLPPGPRTVIEDGAQALRWTATDQNGDVLGYSLFYRAGNESDWKVLAEGLRDTTFYTIEPDTLPDGMYVIRLVASDIGSNPPEAALTDEIITRPFAIDNTPPVVNLTAGAVEGRSVTVEAIAIDQTSTLKQAETSVDAGPWRPVFPEDGIVDTLSEAFRFTVGPLETGEHVIAFRIYDQNENVGIGKTIVQIP